MNHFVKIAKHLYYISFLLCHYNHCGSTAGVANFDLLFTPGCRWWWSVRIKNGTRSDLRKTAEPKGTQEFSYTALFIRNPSPTPIFISPLLDQWDPSLFPSTILNTELRHRLRAAPIWGIPYRDGVHSSIFVCLISPILSHGGFARHEIPLLLSVFELFLCCFFFVAITSCLPHRRAVSSQNRQTD